MEIRTNTSETSETEQALKVRGHLRLVVDNERRERAQDEHEQTEVQRTVEEMLQHPPTSESVQYVLAMLRQATIAA